MSFYASMNLTKLRALGLIVLFSWMLSACAALQYEKPQVSLVSISPSKNNGLDIGFNITLKVTNPNAIPLPIKGINYAIALNGSKLAHGSTSQVPTIPARGSENIDLSFSTNLLSAPQFLVGLLSKSSSDIDYELTGSMDLGKLLPNLAIREAGKVPLR